ncbi:MAG: DUF2225 domain-containing protein [Cellulosilyticaceae bacterium]
MSIFKDLKKFGFSDMENIDVFAKRVGEKQTSGNKEEKIEDILYDKTYECPICEKKFTSKAIRTGKNRLIKTDTDLKPQYSMVNPILYDVIHCECGYTALAKVFASLTPMQYKLIKEEICARFKEGPRNECRTTEEAIDLYKLALLNTIVKKGRFGERAYICLKIAWLYRDLKDENNEIIFLNHAVNGFQEAISTERFPVFEFDENTATYIIADIYRQLGKKEEALRWVSTLVLSSGVSPRLKEKAKDLKDIIRDTK